ncbi:MAG: signal peptidase I, partial [Lachnospiraceae bacterium]|nr:signal peptidase I [Lachnospiraceae bacterium]
MDTEFIKKITKVIMQVVFIVAIVYFLSYTFFCKILMQGFSMKDTIQDKNIVLVNRLYKRFLPIDRYDIIALKIDNQETVKRVIGLPGDTIKISSGVIFVNDDRLDEKYAKNEVTNPTRIVTSTIKVVDGVGERVSCKTSNAIPKGKIFDCMD